MPTPIKKVTLELIYDAVDERTQDIKPGLCKHILRKSGLSVNEIHKFLH